jgi:predicted phage tail protein
MNATVTPGALAAGTHQGTVTVRGTGAVNSPVLLPVTLSITNAPALVPGTPRANLGAAAGNRAYFVVNVPASAAQLTVAISGGTGDADLYVRYGEPPTLDRYDCRPFAGGSTESCQLNLPAPGTYYVMLNAYSGYSGVTLAASLGGPPAAPANLRATGVTAAAVNLAWADGSSNESSFTLARSTMSGAGTWGPYANIASPAANATAFSNTGVATGTSYRYRLRACNVAGCSAWATSAVVATPGVAPPTGVSAAAASGSSVRVAWTDASTNETGFQVQRRLRNADLTWGPWAAAGAGAANATGFTSTGLAGGSTWQFQVRACNAATCSAWVASAAVTVPVPPGPPSNVASAAISATAVRVTWTDGSTNEASFTVQRRLRAADGTWGAFVTVATPAANAVAFTNTGLATGSTYQYRVFACNVAGCSAAVAAPAVTVTTPAG